MAPVTPRIHGLPGRGVVGAVTPPPVLSSARRPEATTARPAEVPLRLLEAVGLEVSVRAWWRGAPTAGNRAQQVWLRASAAGARKEGAKAVLQRSGIPDRVLDAGLQLGSFLKEDAQVQALWQNHFGSDSSFVGAAVGHVFRRFDIQAAPLNLKVDGQAPPSLILMPRAPSAPPPVSGKCNAEPQQRTETSPPLPSPSWTRRDIYQRRPRDTGSLSGRVSAPPDLPPPPRLVEDDRENTDDGRRNRTGSLAFDRLPPRPRSSSAVEHWDPDHASMQDASYARQASGASSAASSDRRQSGFDRPRSHSDTAGKFARSGDVPQIASIGPRLRSLKRKVLSKFEMWVLEQAEAAKERQAMGDLQGSNRQNNGDAVEPSQLLAGSGKAEKSMKKVIRDPAEIMRLFKHFDKDDSGSIEPHEYLPLLARLMNVPVSQMDMAEVWKSWDQIDADGSGHVSFDEFQLWYCQTFAMEPIHDFTDFFTEEGLVPEDELQIREVSKKLGVDNILVEKAWSEFSRLDADGSGRLEYEEFKVLLQNHLEKFTGGDSHKEVCEKMLEKFWMDVDSDADGNINFEEFAGFFLKFFHKNETPMELYYKLIGSDFRKSLLGASEEAPDSVLRTSSAPSRRNSVDGIFANGSLLTLPSVAARRSSM